MEDYGLLSKYENFQAFAQFEQIFKVADSLLSAQNNSQSINDSLKPFYEKSQVPDFLFRSVLESSPIGIVCVDSTGQVTYYNQKFIDIWRIPVGVSATQKYSQYVAYCQTRVKDAENFCSYIEAAAGDVNAAGLRVVELIDGKTVQQAFQPQALAAMQNGLENKPRTKSNGDEVQQSTGQVWGYLEAAQVELKRDQTSDFLTSDFLSWANTTTALIFIICDGRLAYANQRAQQVSGYSEQAIIKHPQFQRWATNLSQQFTGEAASQSSGQRHEQRQTYPFVAKNNQIFWLQASGSSLRLGNKDWVIVSAADVTALRRKELSALELLATEKAVSQKRQHLAEVVTHRLVNSLSYISMVTDSIERYYEQWDASKRKKYLSRLRENSHRVHQCANRLNELCQLTTGEFTDCLSLIDAYKTCWYLTEEFKKLYPQHAFVALSVADSTQIHLNENLLKVVLFSLLENASKYSPFGSLIKLSFSREANRTVFRVCDQGIGVIAAERDKVLQPFCHGSNSRDMAGLGLGLAIAQAITAVQGGHIAFDDSFEKGTAQKGTVVSVSFPLKQSTGYVKGDRAQWHDHSLESLAPPLQALRSPPKEAIKKE